MFGLQDTRPWWVWLIAIVAILTALAIVGAWLFVCAKLAVGWFKERRGDRQR